MWSKVIEFILCQTKGIIMTLILIHCELWCCSKQINIKFNNYLLQKKVGYWLKSTSCHKIKVWNDVPSNGWKETVLSNSSSCFRWVATFANKLSSLCHFHSKGENPLNVLIITVTISSNVIGAVAALFFIIHSVELWLDSWSSQSYLVLSVKSTKHRVDHNSHSNNNNP